MRHAFVVRWPYNRREPKWRLTMPTTTAHPFTIRTDEILKTLAENGQYKHLQMLEGPMGATVRMR